MAFPGFPGAAQFGPQPPLGGSVFLNTVAQGGGSLFPGYNQQPGHPAGQIPGLGMFNQYIQPMIHGMLGNMGMVPGQFMGTQNLYDQYAQQRRIQNLQTTLGRGAQIDRPAMTDFISGVGRSMGMDMGLNERGTVAAMSGHLASMLPWAAQMDPDLLDRVFGSKGSATVLGRGIQQGGRFAIDPGSGMRELAPETATAFLNAIKGAVDTPGSEFRQHGMSMGQAGLAYEQLTRRGLLGVRSIGTRTREEQENLLDMDTADGGAEAFRGKLREFDAEAVKDKLGGLAGTVSAMREIFGDLGNPNAPMSQIIDGLNALTQGGLASMPHSQLERMVRMTKAVADNTGMGIDALQALTSGAANMGDQLGLHRGLAVVAGQRGAIGGRAVADMGWAGVFGAVDSSEAAGMTTKAITQGMASQAGNSAAALFRMEEQIAGGNFQPGTRAARLAAAVRSGATTFEGKPIVDTISNAGAMRKIMQDSGMNETESNMYMDFMADPAGNQAYMAANPEVVDSIATMQSQEVGGRVMGMATGLALSRVLNTGPLKGLSDAKKRRVSGISNQLASEIWESASADDRRTPEAWEDFVESKARPLLKAQGLTDAQIDQMMPSLAAGMEAEGNRQAAAQGYDNLTTALQVQGGQTLEQRRRVRAEARQDAAIRGALDPLSSRGPLSKFMDAMQEVGADGTLPTIGGLMADMLGGIDSEELRRPLEEAFIEIRKARTTLGNPDATDSEKAKALKDLQKYSRIAGETLDNAGDAYLSTTMTAGTTKGAKDKYAALARTTTATPEATQKIERQYNSAAKATRSLTNQLLGDENAMKQLGKGGMDLVEGLEADQAELDRLIVEHGSLEAAREAEGGRVGELINNIQTGTAEVHRLFEDQDITGMTEDEKIRRKEREKQAGMDPQERKEAVADMLAKLADTGRGAVDMEKLGTGADLRTIERAAQRELRIRELTTRTSLTTAEQKELDQLESQGGREFENVTSGGEQIDAALTEGFERDEDWIEQQKLGDQAPLITALSGLLENIKIEFGTLTMNADGSGEVAPDGDPAGTPPN
jgi:hypothetical protein